MPGNLRCSAAYRSLAFVKWIHLQRDVYLAFEFFKALRLRPPGVLLSCVRKAHRKDSVAGIPQFLIPISYRLDADAIHAQGGVKLMMLDRRILDKFFVDLGYLQLLRASPLHSFAVRLDDLLPGDSLLSLVLRQGVNCFCSSTITAGRPAHERSICIRFHSDCTVGEK